MPDASRSRAYSKHHVTFLPTSRLLRQRISPAEVTASREIAVCGVVVSRRNTTSMGFIAKLFQ
jgi:hypothetical protein